MDTGLAFQESILNIDFLDPVAWINSEGKEVKIADPNNLKARPTDIQFICYHCQMNVSSVDARVVTVPDLSFYFPLKLPQSTYNNGSGLVTAVDSRISDQRSLLGIVRSLGTCFVASNGTPSTLTVKIRLHPLQLTQRSFLPAVYPPL